MNYFPPKFMVSVFMLLAATCFAQDSSMLTLECRPSPNRVFEIQIDLKNETFNVFEDGVIDEGWNRKLTSISAERIVLYDSYGGTPMYVDRLRGTYVRMRTVTQCVRTTSSTIRRPKF